MTTRFSLLTAASLCVLSAAAPAATAAPVVVGLAGAKLVAISADGTTALGSDSLGTFKWTQAAGKVYLDNAGVPYGISANGSVAAGTAQSPTAARGFYYDTTVHLINGLGASPFPGIPAYARVFAISGDGLTMVGACSSSQTSSQAFSYSNGTSKSLGDLAGGAVFSEAFGVSGDGSVIVGESQTASGREAFVKIGSAAMKTLGDLPGGAVASTALAVSADGTTVVGFGSSTVTSSIVGNVAFRCPATGGLVKLGIPDLGSNFVVMSTQANAVANQGAVVVGQAGTKQTVSNPDNTTTTIDKDVAIAWVGSKGTRLSDLLVAAGGNASVMDEATGISADADVLVGNSPAGAWIILGARPMFGLSSTAAIAPVVSVQVSGGSTTIHFDTVPNQSYQVQRSDDLSTGWTDVGSPFVTTGQSGAGTHDVTDTVSTTGKAFYRVVTQSAS